MIEFNDVSLHFGGQEVLRHVGLRIGPGERVGVVGPNGAGKSTLFALITGEITPFRGKVTLPRDARLGHVRQQLPPDDGGVSLLDFCLSGMEDLHAMEARIDALAHVLETLEVESAERKRRLREMGELETRFDHLGGYDSRSRAEAVLCGLGFPAAQLQQRLAAFSGGWRMRAELARALVMQPDILLLDEPSNYLDIPAVEWLQRFLRDFEGTMLLISHDRYLLRSLSSVTVETMRGEVTRYEGGFDYYIKERAQRIAAQAAAAKNQDRKRQQIEQFIERFRAKNTKASQVQSRIKALEKMEAVAHPPPVTVAVNIRLPPPPPCGHEMLRLEQVGLTYDSKRWVFRNVDFNIQRGDRIALVGYNGMGKTSLLRVMAGVRSPSAGRCVAGHKVKIGYQSQEFAETISPGLAVFDVVQKRNPRLSQGEVRSILGSYGFSGDTVKKMAEILSGGEKIRLAFARLFADPPNLLLLDEPTTHLDMAGRESLEQLLCDYPGAICFVSHDVEFVRRLATGVAALTETGVERYAGSYDDYRERCRAKSESCEGVPQGSGSGAVGASTGGGGERKIRRRERAESRRDLLARTRGFKRQMAVAEKALARLDGEQKSLLSAMSESGGISDYAVANRRLYEISIEIEQHTSAWEQAAEAVEKIKQ